MAESSTTSSRQSEASRLLTIAQELRNEIFAHVVRAGTGVKIKGDETCDSNPTRRLETHPLAQTCRQLRDELADLYEELGFKYAKHVSIIYNRESYGDVWSARKSCQALPREVRDRCAIVLHLNYSDVCYYGVIFDWKGTAASLPRCSVLLKGGQEIERLIVTAPSKSKEAVEGLRRLRIVLRGHPGQARSARIHLGYCRGMFGQQDSKVMRILTEVLERAMEEDRVRPLPMEKSGGKRKIEVEDDQGAEEGGTKRVRIA